MHKNTQRSELEYWLALYLMKGIGFQTASKLLSCYNFDQIFCESNKHSLTNLIPHQLASSITSFDWCKLINFSYYAKAKTLILLTFPILFILKF
jgi:DNA processing protein